jgi:hypothetical protein
MENMEKTNNLNNEMIWKILKKAKLNSDKIWTIWKKIGKWYGNYEIKVSWIVKRYGKYGRKSGNDMEIMKEKSVE